MLKATPVYAAIGDVDELGAAAPRAACSPGAAPRRRDARLERVQADLLDVGSALCTPRGGPLGPRDNARKLRRTRGVTRDAVAAPRRGSTTPTRACAGSATVLVGGSAGAAALHVARAVCRRAERAAWPLLHAGHCREDDARDARGGGRGDDDDRDGALVGVYLNRLSDYLFVIARLDAKASGAEEKEYRIERKVDRWQRRVVAVGEADDGE